jgi:hypothetical protein
MSGFRSHQHLSSKTHAMNFRIAENISIYRFHIIKIKIQINLWRFIPSDAMKFSNFERTLTIFVILKGFAHVFLVCCEITCYQIAIRCILNVTSEKRGHATVPSGQTWRSVQLLLDWDVDTLQHLLDFILSRFWVTIDGVGIGDWIYWLLYHNTCEYN